MAALEARSLLTRETIRSLDALYPAGVGGIIGMVGGLRLERWAAHVGIRSFNPQARIIT